MRSALVSGLAGLLLLSTGCAATDSPEPSAEPAPAGQASAPTPSADELIDWLRFSFEDLPVGDLPVGSVVHDDSGNGNDGTVVADPAGEVPDPRVVASAGEARAISFPQPCEATSTCHRAIIEVPDTLGLNPGTRDFAFGAVLRTSHTDAGANVIQKGYSTQGPSQWKLQVDGKGGRPSCVLVGESGAVVQKVVAARSVADGAWHTVDCVRRGVDLTIVVDGDATPASPAVAPIEIDNPSPVRIGGKYTETDSDPFFGEVDGVYFGTLLD